MRIERIEDKKFMITLTEKEALKISDNDQTDFYDYKILVLRLGRLLLEFMIRASQLPDAKQPFLEAEL